MFGWFKGLDLVNKLSVGLILFGLFMVAIVTVNHFTDRAFESAKETGAANVRVIVAEEGMSNVEDANEAAAEVKRDPVVRNADCLRDSRTPESC